MANDVFVGLQPAAVWQHFAAFTAIARPSGQEAAMADYVRNVAATHGFEVAGDTAGNVRVRVPATPGYESRPRVILQAHLDMVCSRDAEAGDLDPLHGRIRVFRARQVGQDVVEDPNGDWVKAFHTTLGADNGIGVAALLAVASDPGVVHGPMDLLFTVQEEAGLVGATALDAALLDARIVLNVDSEDQGVFTIGSAGGREILLHWPRCGLVGPGQAVALRVSIGGLRGGHSGVDINRGRLNAIRALASLLQYAGRRMPIQLASIVGGDRSNAIPRAVSATVVVTAADEALLRSQIGEAVEQLLAWSGEDEPGLRASVEAVTHDGPVHTASDTASLLNLVRAIPTGVIAMSQDLPGLVETSNNLGVVSTNSATVVLTCSSRSAVNAALDDVTATVTSVASLAGAGADPRPNYPGWKPDPASTTLATMTRTYRELFGHDAAVSAVHAGLECGVLNGKVPDLDIVSFGPTIAGAHSTQERVHIPSVANFYRLLGAALGALAA